MNKSFKLFALLSGLVATLFLLSIGVFAQSTHTYLELGSLVQGTLRQGETAVYRFDASDSINPTSLSLSVQGNQARLGFRVIHLRTSSIVSSSEPPVISSAVCFAPNSGTFELQVWHAEGTASQPYNITYSPSNDNNCSLSGNGATVLTPGTATSINVSSMGRWGATLPILNVVTDPNEDTVIVIQVPDNNGNNDGDNNREGNDDDDDGNNNGGDDDGDNNGDDDGNNNGGDDDGDDNDGEVIITDPDTNEIIDRHLLDGGLILRLPGGRDVNLQLLLNGGLSSLGNVNVLVDTAANVSDMLGLDFVLDAVPLDGLMPASVFGGLLDQRLMEMDSLGQMLHLNLDGTVNLDGFTSNLLAGDVGGAVSDLANVDVLTDVMGAVNEFGVGTDIIGGAIGGGDGGTGNLVGDLVGGLTGGNGTGGLIATNVDGDANASGIGASLGGNSSGFIAGAIQGDATGTALGAGLGGDGTGGLVGAGVGGSGDGGLVGAGLGGSGTGGAIGAGVGGDGTGGIVGAGVGGSGDGGLVGAGLGGDGTGGAIGVGMGGDGTGGLVGVGVGGEGSGDLIGVSIGGDNGGLGVNIGGENGVGVNIGGGDALIDLGNNVPCIPIPFVVTCRP